MRETRSPLLQTVPVARLSTPTLILTHPPANHQPRNQKQPDGAARAAAEAALADRLPAFLGLIGDADRRARKAAVLALSSVAHHRPRLAAPRLPALLPTLYAQTEIVPELIRTVDLGPFKHKVGAQRGSASTVLRTCYSTRQAQHISAPTALRIPTQHPCTRTHSTRDTTPHSNT